MQIKEITHHGSFREERVVEVPALGTKQMLSILADCPYSYDHARAGELVASLQATGKAEWGWTTWTVVGGASNIINLPTGGNA